MKRTMRVTETKEFEIDIPDKSITEEFLKDFGECIGYSDYADTAEDKVEEIFKSIAWQIRHDVANLFVEGVGTMKCSQYKTTRGDEVGTYELTFEDNEIEWVDSE